MTVFKLAVATLVMSAPVLWGQARVVRATGGASLSVKPDVVKLAVGVVTTADTAQAAAAQNAGQMDAVLARLKQVLGSSGDTRTISYSITPNYRSGQPPVLSGFTASNTVEVTTADLSSIGAVIDAASVAGANSIGGLRFTVKDEEPVRAQALAAAAKQARAHADAIASGLNARTGAVISAQEGSSVTPLMLDTAGAARTTTPIEPGLVQVSATVTVDVELI